MKLKFILALGDVLRDLRTKLPGATWEIVYDAVSAYAQRFYLGAFSAARFRRYVDSDGKDVSNL